MDPMTVIISAAKYTFGAFLIVIIVSYIMSKVKNKNTKPQAVELRKDIKPSAPIVVKKISEAQIQIKNPEKEYYDEKKYGEPKLIRFKKEELVSANSFVKSTHYQNRPIPSRYAVVNKKEESLVEKNYVAFL